MHKLHSIFLAVLITSIIAFNLLFISGKLSFSPKHLEKVEVVRVIDGDTLDLSDGRRLRLANINAPEKNTEESSSAIKFLNKFVNKTIEVEIIGEDKYGKRYVARIYSISSPKEYLYLKMVRECLASKAWVEKSELAEFSKAESLAVNEENGIWKHSPFYSCISLKVYAEEEKVSIDNDCPTFRFADSWIKDESREIFTFPSTTVNFISYLALYSGKGVNNETLPFRHF